MDDTSNTLFSAAANHSFCDFVDGVDAGEEYEEEEDDESCDVETWQTLKNSFKEVQSLFYRNRRLIQKVNDNHRSKIPQNLAENVGLICEINSNMSKAVEIYSNLSAILSTTLRQRRAVAESAGKKVEP